MKPCDDAKRSNRRRDAILCAAGLFVLIGVSLAVWAIATWVEAWIFWRAR